MGAGGLIRGAVLTAAGIMAATVPASAEVKSATDQGFEIADSVVVAVAPAAAYDALGHIGGWWDAEHSYSHDAANLSLDLRAGGCFCETLPASGGGVEHMRVVYVDPGRMVRMRGALGPAQGEGVEGALTWAFAPADGGGTRISVSYVLGGYLRTNPRTLAPAFDAVLAEQLARLKAYAEAHADAAGARRRP